MFLLKRLLLLSGSSGVAYSSYATIKPLLHWETPNKNKALSFINLSDSGTTEEQFNKLLNPHKIYETNVLNFSENFLSHFAKLFLFEWIEKETSGTNKNTNLLIELEKLKQEKFTESSLFDEANERHWKINKLFSAAKQLFKDEMFKTWYLEMNGDDIKIQDSQNNNVVAKFQKELLNKWISEKQPFFIMEEKWDYSKNKPSTNLYAENEIKEEKASSYQFPDFETEPKGYKDLITKLKKKTFSNSSAEEKIISIHELSRLQDSHLLSGLFYVYSQLSGKSKQTSNDAGANVDPNPKIKDLDLSNGTFSSQYEQNPVYLFLDKLTTPNPPTDNTCAYINKNIFADAIKTKVADTNQTCALSCIAKKTTDNNTNNVFFIRHLSGVSAFYESFKTDKFNKKIVDKVSESITKKTPNSTSQSFMNFIDRNFERLLLAFVSGEQNTDTWLNKNSQTQVLLTKTELLKAIVDFATTLNTNKNYYVALGNLNKISAQYVNAKSVKDTTSNKVHLENIYGLATPLLFKSTLDDSTTISDIEFKSKDKKTDWTNNDGSFALLKDIFKQTEYDNLHTKHQELKNKIKEHVTNDLQKHYVLSAIHNKFIENIDLTRRYVENTRMLDELMIDVDNHDFSNYVTEITTKLNDKLIPTNKLTDEKIKHVIYETFHLIQYQNEPIDTRLIFGGYKKDESSQILIKSSNYWKLKNYFFTGNAYNISSTENAHFLKHLFLMKWLLTSDNISWFFNKIIPKHEYAVLMWTDEINKEKYAGLEIESSESLPKSLKNLDTKYFKNHDSLFNPFFSVEKFNKQTNGYSPDTNFFPISAIAYKENVSDTNSGTEKNLYGFSGLQTSKHFVNFSPTKNQEIDDCVKNIIFSKLSQAHSSDNKNYLAPSNTTYQADEPTPGTSFGVNSTHTSSVDTLETDAVLKFLDSFKTKQRLMEFIQGHCKDLFAKISSSSNPSALDIDGLKQEIKKQLNTSENLTTTFKRFSGVLHNPDAYQFTDNTKRYLLNTEAWKKQEGRVVFIKQVNQYDFTKNISTLSYIINPETLVKTLFLLSYHPETSNILKKTN